MYTCMQPGMLHYWDNKSSIVKTIHVLYNDIYAKQLVSQTRYRVCIIIFL